MSSGMNERNTRRRNIGRSYESSIARIVARLRRRLLKRMEAEGLMAMVLIKLSPIT